MKFTSALFVSVAGTALIAGGAASAQEAEDQGIGEIVVTAQKRSQSIERVPISVQVQTGEQIAAFQQPNLKSIAVNVPNLVLTTSPSGSVSAAIRGFGTTSANAAFEQTVALYVDGIYAPRPQLYTGGVYDVDRVEVVKGTQGALFGKNASVGAISLVTRGPQNEFGGYVNLAYNFRFEQPRIEGAINAPLGDRFRVRVAGFYDNAGRGWVPNLALGGAERPVAREYAGRAKAEFDVTDNLTLSGKLEFDKYSRNGDALISIGGTKFKTVTIDDPITNASSNRIPENNGQTASFRDTGTQGLGFKWNIGDVTVTGISGWQQLDYHTFVDVDRTAGPVDSVNRFSEKFSQFTQEVRFATPDSGPWSAMGGLFYLRQHFDVGVDQRQANFAYNLLSQDDVAYSGFGQLVLRPSDRLTLTASARYTHEEKDGVLTVRKTTGTAATAGSVDSNSLDWSGNVEFRIADRTSLYGSVSRGHKAPGFVNTVGGPTALVPARLIWDGERATNYEVGLKARLLDNRARLSVAVFSLDVANFQAAQLVAASNSFVVANRDARARGVEAQFEVRPVPALRLNTSVAYNDATFKDDGTQLTGAPKWNTTVGVDFSPALSDELDLQSGILFNYISRFPHQFDLAAGNFTPGHTNLDARIGIKFKPSGIQLGIVGKNLTDERYAEFAFGNAFDIGAFTQLANQPRNISMTANIPF